MRGLVFEGVTFLYEWDDNRKELVVRKCSKLFYIGKELWKAISQLWKRVRCKSPHDNPPIRILTESQINKALYRL